MYETYLIISFDVLSIFAYSQSTTPEQAKDSIGITVTVRGTVNGTHTTAIGVTFVNIGGKYPNNPFIVVVFKYNVAKFSYQLSTLEGKDICLSGIIKDFKGKSKVIADSDKQIVVNTEERE